MCSLSLTVFFFFFCLFRLLTVAFVVTQTQYLGLLSSSSLMKVSFSLIIFFFCKVCVNVGLMGLTIWGIIVGARAALNLSGTILGFYPVKVMPSKTAIAPVNPTLLPRVRHFFCLVFHHSLSANLCAFYDSALVLFLVIRLKMSVRSVRELSIALTSTRR